MSKRIKLTELLFENTEKINEEVFVDIYSFENILPRKSRYKFKQSVNEIIDSLENANVDESDIRAYMKELLETALRIETHSVFRDY